MSQATITISEEEANALWLAYKSPSGEDDGRHLIAAEEKLYDTLEGLKGPIVADAAAVEAACRATWDEWDRDLADAGDPEHTAHAAEVECAILAYLDALRNA